MDPISDAEILRAGARPLVVLATTLNFLIIRALARRPMRLAELRRATGLSAQTTLRAHLASLDDLRIVAKRPSPEAPYPVEYELTPVGRELLRVAESLEAWLNRAPDGPLSLEAGPAKGVIKAFVDGWVSTILGALARRPMSLTELDGVIPALSYPALERRLSTMRIAGLVEAAPSNGGGTPYAVSDWARQGVVPLVAAAHCDHLQMQPPAAALTQVDIEAGFMLSLPLVGLPGEARGRCHLTVEGDPAKGRERSGVEVIVEGGQVVACAADVATRAGQYATGSAATWFSALRDPRAELEYAGGKLPVQLVSALRETLLQSPPNGNGVPPGTARAQPAAATSAAAASPTNGTSSS